MQAFHFTTLLGGVLCKLLSQSTTFLLACPNAGHDYGYGTLRLNLALPPLYRQLGFNCGEDSVQGPWKDTVHPMRKNYDRKEAVTTIRKSMR